MTPGRWQRTKELFQSAADRPSEDRDAFLRDACGSDHQLRRDVERMLRHGFGHGPLDRPAWDGAPLDTGLAAGARLGPYQIIEEIGAGGMGRVYTARDTRLGRTVAIKISSAEFSHRFQNEARTISSFNHPHICALHDIGEQDGIGYLVMEFVEGESLASRLTRGPLPFADALRYGAEIAAALSAAHALNIVHRDLKPANIMITSSGVKVLDFGLAEIASQRPIIDPPEIGQAVVGTLTYMSPEQLEGKPADARSDIFALGLVLHEMVAGQRPFPAHGRTARIAEVSNTVPPPLVGAPPELSKLIARCLQTDVDLRAQNMDEVRRALENLKQEPTSPRPGIPKTWVAVAVLLGIAALPSYWLWTRAGRTTQARNPSIAVLPLENLSADPEQEYFSDGMTDALLTDLAKIHALSVISRTSVMQYKRTRKRIPEIARELKLDYIVEGTVTRAGDRVRITAQLIAGPSDRHVWAETYERSGKDVLNLQGELARAIAEQVHIHITPQERARLGAPPVSLEARDSYLKGRFAWQTRQIDRVRQSIGYFNRAIAIEPGYALAYAGLADSYSVLSSLAYAGLADSNSAPPERAHDPSRQEMQTRSCEAAKKALQLDENLAEAHASLAACTDNWDWTGREQHFRRAIEISPSYATGHMWYGSLLTNMGRLQEGLSEIQRAAELDPLSPSSNYHLGWALYLARQYDRSVQQLRQNIELFPALFPSYSELGIAYTAKGMYAEAFNSLEKAMKLTGGATPVAALLAHAHARAGDPGEARRLLREFERRQEITPVVFALLYLDVGDKDHAFQWFDKAVEQRSLFSSEIKVEPMYDSLHTDPRFAALLRKMNLPD